MKINVHEYITFQGENNNNKN